jgi:hypothetical protein
MTVLAEVPAVTTNSKVSQLHIFCTTINNNSSLTNEQKYPVKYGVSLTLLCPHHQRHAPINNQIGRVGSPHAITGQSRCDLAETMSYFANKKPKSLAQQACRPASHLTGQPLSFPTVVASSL